MRPTANTLSQEDMVAFPPEQKKQLHLNNLKVCNKINKVNFRHRAFNKAAGAVHESCTYRCCPDNNQKIGHYCSVFLLRAAFQHNTKSPSDTRVRYLCTHFLCTPQFKSACREVKTVITESYTSSHKNIPVLTRCIL